MSKKLVLFAVLVVGAAVASPVDDIVPEKDFEHVPLPPNAGRLGAEALELLDAHSMVVVNARNKLGKSKGKNAGGSTSVSKVVGCKDSSCGGNSNYAEKAPDYSKYDQSRGKKDKSGWGMDCADYYKKQCKYYERYSSCDCKDPSNKFWVKNCCQSQVNHHRHRPSQVNHHRHRRTTPPPSPPPWWKDLGHGFVFMGCYKDSKKEWWSSKRTRRDLPVHMQYGTSSQRQSWTYKQSIQACAYACHKYRFFGQQWDRECFCGNHYGIYGKSTCSCTASNIGAWRNCVYMNKGNML